MTKKDRDFYFMNIALREAEKGCGFTKLNPMVGAVLVKNGKVISKGYHKFFGGAHAEVDALKKLRIGEAKNSILYVTLEPCSTTGKTAPCTDAIIKAGIKKVVIAQEDPNPLNGKKGIDILRKKGIEVEVGILEDKAKCLNEAFHLLIREKRPFVTLKLAMSLNGKITNAKGVRTLITNDSVKKYVHKLRYKHDAVLIGKNTALIDDPMLTIRDIKAIRQPDRVLLDSNAEVPLSKKIFIKSESERIFVVLSSKVTSSKLNDYMLDGVIPIVLDDHRSIGTILKKLFDFNIGSLLVEGGSMVSSSFLKQGFIDKFILFYAPMIFHNKNALDAFTPESSEISNILLEKTVLKKLGDNYLIEGYPKKYT